MESLRGIVLTPLSVFSSLYRHAPLIWALTKRDVVGRYRGSVLGLLWSLFNPIFLLAVYTLVFKGIFITKTVARPQGNAEFALFVFSGMIVHLLFAECVNRAPNLVLSNVNYVKRVVFPLEILPWVALGSALFHALVSVAVLVVAYAVMNHQLHWTLVFLPLPIVCLMLLTMGVSWVLASLGVYLRDVMQTVAVLTSVLLFLSPVFYEADQVPAAFRGVIRANPLTFIIEQFRDVALWGKLPNWGMLALYFAGALLLAWLGLLWFHKTRKGFADVI